MLYIIQNICDSDDIFLLIDTYATQVFNLFADCSVIEVWGLLPLSTTIGGEVEKLVRRNWLPLFVKISALLLDSQDSG